MEGGIVAWGLSPSLVGLAQKTISETRVPRVSFRRSSFVITYLVCVTYDVVSYFTMIISFHYIVFIRVIDYKTIFPKLSRFPHWKIMWVGVFDPIHGLCITQMAPSILACAQLPTLRKKI